MDLNPAKWFVISFSRAMQTPPFSYCLNNDTIKRVDKVRNLCVLLSFNLDPGAHVLDIFGRANRVLCLSDKHAASLSLSVQ